MEKVANSFVLVNQNKVVSPVLITVRSYGSWFEGTYDEYTSQMELYLRAKTGDGSILLEYHPGTKIGHWFDLHNRELTSDKLKCWYIPKESPVMDRLVKLKLAQNTDSNIKDGKQVLRVYTKDQIELYLKTLFREKIEIPVGTPKQIKVKDTDLGSIIKPEFIKTKKKLF